MKKGVSNRLCLLFTMLGTLAMLAGCGGDDQVGDLLHPADVRCEISKVWAGPGGASPLPQLTDCGSGISNNWHNLPAGGWVTTDDSGEAWIDIDGCLIIYLFAHNGELRKAACSEGSGGITCSFSGTSVYNNQCASEIIIQTPSAQLVLEGTWLPVTYLPEMQLTLTMVLEGTVDVQPVLNFEEYTLGDTIQVEEGAFLFTAPGDEPPFIGGLAGREAIPFEKLPLVIAELTVIEPNLEQWLDRIKELAEDDGVSSRDVACSMSPGSPFDDMGSAPKLGCPEAPADTTRYSHQRFEGGEMIYRHDLRLIYVLYYTPNGWEQYPDTYNEGEPWQLHEYEPPPGLEQPIKGFDRIWENHPEVRDRIGWALQGEVGLIGGNYEDFQNGTALWLNHPEYIQGYYLLFDDGTWQHGEPQ